MELCLRIENILKGSREWFTLDNSRSGTCSSEVVKRSLIRLVWEVRWMKSKERVVSNGEPPTARVEQRRMQLHEGWKRKQMNAELSEPWQEALLHERLSTIEQGHTCS